VSGNYGPGDGGPWPPAGNEPQWDDSVWQQDQPSAWNGQEGAQPGYGQQQPYDGRGYGGQDYDQGQGYDQGRGYPGQAYPGQGYGGPGYEQPGYDARNYGQPDPRTQPGYPPQGPGTGSQQYPRTGQQSLPRGTGGQRAQRGTGGMQPVPPGYDPRGAGPRRPAGGSGDRDYPSGGYPQRGDAGYGPAGYEGRDPGQRDDSFLPGFGPRDDFDGGDQQYDGRGARRGAARRARDGRADGRAADIGRGPDGRAVDFAGQDQRARGARDDRDPRGPRPVRRDRDDWDGAGGNGGAGGYGGDGPRRRRRSPIRRLAPWIALLVIVVPLAVGGLHIWDIYQAKVHPADYTGSGTKPTVTVQVTSDESAQLLAPTMVKDGVVASTRAFVLAAENSSNPTGLEPGYFILNSHMQASAAWAYLTNPKNMLQTVVTIPEGKRASQVIAIVAQKTKIPLKNFQTVLDHPSKLGLPSYAQGKVEGYLFPATYAIVPHETALQILQAMVTRFNQEASSAGLQAAAQRLGISATDVIIEASMAQAEGGSVSDYPKIAEVINNRLRIHMALQFDSVLLYGLNKYAINVTDAQIATPGPYNDFEHSGLPPGPISNPGDAAIQGILRPDTGNWLYFLTVSGGKSEFSATPLAGQ
jgi:uncharacterized YceG family protein